MYDPRALHAIFLKDQEKEVFTRDLSFTTYVMLTLLYIGATASHPQSVLHSGLNILLGPGLLTTAGAVHRKQRRMLQPVFSATHLRNMTPTFYDITRKVRSRDSPGLSNGVD